MRDRKSEKVRFVFNIYITQIVVKERQRKKTECTERRGKTKRRKGKEGKGGGEKRRRM